MLARQSPTPLYRQLKERLVREVDSGERAPHSQLPSEREWVDSLKVSRITVRQALGELVQEGYLYTVPGKGVFVGDRPRARELNAFLSFTTAAESRGEKVSSRVLSARLERASQEVAMHLRLAAGAEVALLRRVRLADKVPMMIQEAYLPHALCPGILERDWTQLSLFATLRTTYHLALCRAHSTITARAASKEERRLLQLDSDAVVLVVDQVSFIHNGQPVERALSILHPVRHPLSLVQEDGGRSLGVV